VTVFTDQVTVRFDGASARSGPLTLAQRNMVRTLTVERQDDDNFSIAAVFEVPEGRSEDDVVAALRTLLLRHESLRTTYDLSGEPVQRVLRAGDLTVGRYEAGPDEDVDKTVRPALTRRPFSLRVELPLRVVLVTREAVPVQVLVVCAHIAADGFSVGLLRGEFGRLLAEPPGGEIRPVGVQPVDLALREASPTARRRVELALRHWESVLERRPRAMFEVPVADVPGTPYAVASIWSAAMAAAVGRIAARTGASRSAVVLAGVGALVCVLRDSPAFVVTSLAANRTAHYLRSYVGNLYQDAAVLFDAASGSFDDVVGAAWKGAIAGYANSRFEADPLWRLFDTVGRRRGVEFVRDCVYSDISAAFAHTAESDRPGEPRALMVRTRVSTEPWTYLPGRFHVSVGKLAGDALLYLWTDTRYLPSAGAEAFLRGLERLLVTAAEKPVPAAEFAAVSGLAPVVRGPDWHWIDSCWVELAAVPRLLTAATGGAPAQAAVAADGSLTGYAVADTTPAALHDACTRLLPEFPAAMAPHRYLIYSRPPADPSTVEAWHAGPPATDGAGR
jgi:hypothetical protein